MYYSRALNHILSSAINFQILIKYNSRAQNCFSIFVSYFILCSMDHTCLNSIIELHFDYRSKSIHFWRFFIMKFHRNLRSSHQNLLHAELDTRLKSVDFVDFVDIYSLAFILFVVCLISKMFKKIQVIYHVVSK